VSLYSELKKIWKSLGVKGAVKNYSNVELWILETDTTGHPIARALKPGYKTPKNIDFDGFKRVDGKAIQRHRNWWKFYDFSTVEVFTDGRGLRISVIKKTPVDERHFGEQNVKYLKGKWGDPLTIILDIKRNSKNKIISYYVNGHGWLDFVSTFKMVCYHEIDNARPVFPKNGKPYIRSKRDKFILNNFSRKGRV
jgi:hypothetical protein